MAIAVDAMGGDSSLTVQIEAAIQAIYELGTDVILVGAEDQIKKVLKQRLYQVQILPVEQLQFVPLRGYLLPLRQPQLPYSILVCC